MAKKKVETESIEKNIVAPNHYQSGLGYQVFDILTDWNFHTYNQYNRNIHSKNIQLIGSAFNVVKYMLRAGKKDLVAQEFGKVVVYLGEIKKYLGLFTTPTTYEITSRKYPVEKVIKDFNLGKEDAKILKFFVEGYVDSSLKAAERKYEKLKKEL